MELIYKIFGEGKDLNIMQMSTRAVLVFIIALILIRISGRRSFGLRMPFDNIIVVLLGAILSRIVVGASPFLPVVAACLIIALIHRLFGWLVVHYKSFRKLVEGDKILVFQKGRFIQKNLDKALACEEDIMQGIRKTVLTDNLEKIDRVYMECNGEISAIEKDKV